MALMLQSYLGIRTLWKAGPLSGQALSIYLLIWFGMLLGMWLELECYWKMLGCWVWVGVLLSVCIGVLECGCRSITTGRGHYCWKSSLKSCCWNISINLWKFCLVT